MGGSVYLPSFLSHSYLVCVVLGMPSLLLDTFLNVSILFSAGFLATKQTKCGLTWLV